MSSRVLHAIRDFTGERPSMDDPVRVRTWCDASILWEGPETRSPTAYTTSHQQVSCNDCRAGLAAAMLRGGTYIDEETTIASFATARVRR